MPSSHRYTVDSSSAAYQHQLISPPNTLSPPKPSHMSRFSERINAANQTQQAQPPQLTTPTFEEQTVAALARFETQTVKAAALPFSDKVTKRKAQQLAVMRETKVEEMGERWEERVTRTGCSTLQRIERADGREWRACPEILRDVYFLNFGYDIVFEEAERERESFDGIKKWLDSVENRNVGTVEEDRNTLVEDLSECVEREGENRPEELRPFYDHYIWSTP
jgi:hypothetical protein